MQRKENSALIGSIQKFSIEDGPGIRTTIFLKGCPLACKWCHNPELIKPQQELMRTRNNCIGCGYCVRVCPQKAIRMDREEGVVIDRTLCNNCMLCAEQCFAKALRPVASEMTVEEVIRIAAQDKGFYDNTGGGITISGGELLKQAAFVERLIDAAAEEKISACLDTSGYGDTKALLKLAKKETVTNILFDIKSVDDDIHRAYTGVSNALILENLRALCSEARIREKITLRMPLIKDVNDGMELIEKTAALYKAQKLKKVDLLPYHNLGIGKQRNIGGTQKEFEKPSEEHLTEIAEFFKNFAKMEVGIYGRA